MGWYWYPKAFQMEPKSTSKSVLDLSFKRNIGFSPIALGLQPELDLAGAGTSQNHSFLIPRHWKNNPPKHTLHKHLKNQPGPTFRENVSKFSPKRTSKSSPKSLKYWPWIPLDSQVVPGTPQTSKNDARDIENYLPERQHPRTTMKMHFCFLPKWMIAIPGNYRLRVSRGPAAGAKP